MLIVFLHFCASLIAAVGPRKTRTQQRGSRADSCRAGADRGASGGGAEGHARAAAHRAGGGQLDFLIKLKVFVDFSMKFDDF